MDKYLTPKDIAIQLEALIEKMVSEAYKKGYMDASLDMIDLDDNSHNSHKDCDKI